MRFLIQIPVSGYVCAYVDARNEQEAKELAEDVLMDEEFSVGELDIGGEVTARESA